MERREVLKGFVAGVLAGGYSYGGAQSALPAVPPESKPVPRGSRLLGVHPTESEKGDYIAGFAQVKAVGAAQIETLSLNWTDIEATPGKYDNPFLGIADGYYSTQKTKILLLLRPVDTNRKQVPTDLRHRRFDDPVMIDRFKKLLDYVFSQIPRLELAALAIGNEVDGYLGTNASRYAEYRTFYEAARAYARTKRPGLRVGFSAMMSGLNDTARKPLQDMNAQSDVILVSYYPLNADFTVKDPAVVRPDWDRVAALYPKRTILFTETGYPSSDVCKSSEIKQAEFVRATFRAWDAHADQVESIVFSWLTDLSPATVKGFTDYYGFSLPAFNEYLRTLGLRTHSGDGQDKQAFIALKEEASARGWKP